MNQNCWITKVSVSPPSLFVRDLTVALHAYNSVLCVAACTSRFCGTADADAAECGAINEGSTAPTLRYNSKCDAACRVKHGGVTCPPQDVACRSGIEGCHEKRP